MEKAIHSANHLSSDNPRIRQRQMAAKLLEASEDRINRNIKDSVFCNLFEQPEYLLQLYRALHPEDVETGPEDLTIITLSRLFVREMYNDLGFMAGNRLLVLVEAQSTWSENIVVRFLLYLGETYRRYIETNGLDLYNSKNIVLPAPELYVVYTGDRAEKPETISLRHSFFGQNCCVEVEAAVIYDSRQGDILNQFITFSKIFDAQRKRYPEDRRRAVLETIRICKNRNILAEYLAKEEAAAVMFTFADQEKEFSKALQREYDEGRSEGFTKGRSEGFAEGQNKGEILGAVKLYRDELSLKPSEIIDRIMKRFSLNQTMAEAYVKEAFETI